MSLWNYRLDQNTNEIFDNFCPGPFRAEIIKFFVGILVQTIFSKRHFEINWPLGIIQNTWEQWIVKGKISDIWHGNLHPRKLQCSKRRPLNFIVLLFCATSDMEWDVQQISGWKLGTHSEFSEILEYWENRTIFA